MEYIDKEIALKGLRMAHDYDGANFIDQLPAADVVPVVPMRWIKVNPEPRGYTDEFECSSCGAHVYLRSYQTDCDYDRCPYCGAIDEEEL